MNISVNQVCRSLSLRRADWQWLLGGGQVLLPYFNDETLFTSDRTALPLNRAGKQQECKQEGFVHYRDCCKAAPGKQEPVVRACQTLHYSIYATVPVARKLCTMRW